MKIENEIEKLTNRVHLLENQNNRFKSLLESAIQLTKQSVSRTSIHKDETEFLTQTIRLIEDEKTQLQEDLNCLKQTENNSLLLNVRQLETENLELRKKVDVLLQEAQKTSKDVKQLKLEHSEFKFLLTQPDSNSEWLRSILQLENFTENSSLALMEQRYQLQQKIFTLERKKTELLHSIEDITAGPGDASPKNRKEIEKAIYNAIDVVAKREYENLYSKVLDLEQERTTLLGELQLVLERSRKEIADEYGNLQKKIMQIEMEKAELTLTLSNLNEDKSDHTLTNEEMSEIESAREENETLDKILNAFTNSPSQVNLHEAIKKENSKYRFVRASVEFCSIM